MGLVTNRVEVRAKTVALPPEGALAEAIPHASGEAIDARGRYRIERELARGGMGVIYQAWDGKLNRAVALKVLLEAHAGNRPLERCLLEEARLTAGLEHPGIVPVFEIGRCVDRRPFFAMGLIEGDTLSQILVRREVRSDLGVWLRPFQQICQAISHAHARGVLHRDLKPENIMLGGFGTVKVIDWGIAIRLAAPEKNAEGELIFGTPAYLPPEQANVGSAILDERADVFSLGGILCEILTGEPPYAGDNPDDVLERACAADLHDCFVRLDASGADHELIALTKSCLDPDPVNRPRDGGAVDAVIQDFLSSGLRRLERDQIRFFELSLDLFCIAGLDGYFRQINANFSRVLGFAEGDLLSRPFVEFVHPEDEAATLEAVARLKDGQRVVGFANRYRRADGGYVRLEWSSRAVPEEGVIYAVARPVP